MSWFSKLGGKTEVAKTESHTEIRTKIEPGQDVDRAILEQLRKVGLDLSAPFHIHYIFTAPTRDSAHQLIRELEARGLHAEVSEEGGRWKIAVPQDVVLTESGMAAQRAEFSSLAGNLGAQYHGWEMKAKQTKSIKLG
jgi:hypothetical protein